MAKTKIAYYCQNCGASYPKWHGKCNACGEWNTIADEVIEKTSARSSGTTYASSKTRAQKIDQIDLKEETRISTKDQELDRVLGNGIVPGSVILLGGEPGIGKSTLMLQMVMQLDKKTLYISGEESLQQIKLRADRIEGKQDTTYLLAATNTQKILHQLESERPDLLIIDSIQTLHTDRIDSSPGSISQIRECASELIDLAKHTQTPVILIGHINKQGSIAGPKVLEHMVDAVLQFEGDRNHAYRILRSQKNRFGSTHELGIYEMEVNGLKPVSNPSDILISKADHNLSGTAIAASVEGMRPLLIEIQALVSSAVYGTPQRTTTGYSSKRLNMLLAVLEKRAGFKLAAKDVFLNITGGIHVDDPALDLAVVASILSSSENIPIPRSTCFATEIGLAGEIRPVQRVQIRIAEAEKMGFKEMIIAQQTEKIPTQTQMDIKRIKTVMDLVDYLF
jgi:DNA repair protein RadA/Sms